MNREQRSGATEDPWSDEPVCKHGVAIDVHCCGCHSGFLFDDDSCFCQAIADLRAEYPTLTPEELRERARPDDEGDDDALEARALMGCL